MRKKSNIFVLLPLRALVLKVGKSTRRLQGEGLSTNIFSLPANPARFPASHVQWTLYIHLTSLMKYIKKAEILDDSI